MGWITTPDNHALITIIVSLTSYSPGQEGDKRNPFFRCNEIATIFVRHKRSLVVWMKRTNEANSINPFSGVVNESLIQDWKLTNVPSWRFFFFLVIESDHRQSNNRCYVPFEDFPTSFVKWVVITVCNIKQKHKEIRILIIMLNINKQEE